MYYDKSFTRDILKFLKLRRQGPHPKISIGGEDNFNMGCMGRCKHIFRKRTYENYRGATGGFRSSFLTRVDGRPSLDTVGTALSGQALSGQIALSGQFFT